MAARNAAKQCSVEELFEFYQQQTYKDAEHLASIGCPLRGSVASPAVHQGGSGEVSRPKAKGTDSDGSEGAVSVRSRGTPLTAEKSSDAEPTVRPGGESDSPLDSPLDLF